jgi:hypothetical protein
MRWVKHDDYALVSECGFYSVAKIGGKDGVRYEVYRTRAHPEGVHLVAHNLETAAEAKKLAFEDCHVPE